MGANLLSFGPGYEATPKTDPAITVSLGRWQNSIRIPRPRSHASHPKQDGTCLLFKTGNFSANSNYCISNVFQACGTREWAAWQRRGIFLQDVPQRAMGCNNA